MRIDRAGAQVLVVDIQRKLLPHIHEHESVVRQTIRLLRGAAELSLPITLSEQYPEGLGSTAAEILDAVAGAPRVTKMTFSVCGDAAAFAQLRSQARRQVILVGIEAHVCVQQTALDLLAAEFQPVVLADAVGSRRAFDCDVAIQRMRHAGVIVTTVEAALFEMTGRCDTELFKRILKIVK